MNLVLMNPNIIELLERDRWGEECTFCKKPQAKWLHEPVILKNSINQKIAKEYWAPLCSLCTLYEAPWDEEDAAGVRTLIEDTEQVRGIVFERDTEGRLVHVEDADRIFYAIVSISRLARSGLRLNGKS